MRATVEKEKVEFVGSTEAQAAFKRIKKAVTEAPVFKLPDFENQFELFTDGSAIGVGTVLTQQQRPIAFASRALNKAERKQTKR
ncbi:hypothetical protein TNCV_1443341 [Trichonephila clavipes]|nr:hypothetical protein TNCV_1443341 [Trichonephila clavipes]